MDIISVDFKQAPGTYWHQEGAKLFLLGVIKNYIRFYDYFNIHKIK